MITDEAVGEIHITPINREEGKTTTITIIITMSPYYSAGGKITDGRVPVKISVACQGAIDTKVEAGYVMTIMAMAKLPSADVGMGITLELIERMEGISQARTSVGEGAQAASRTF